MNLAAVAEEFHRRFEAKMAAREKALAASRRAIRASANAIRAIHRGDLEDAHRLMEDSRSALESGRDAIGPADLDVYYAGFLLDAQKEYAEASLTEAIVTGGELPSPDSLGVEMAAYLNGMAETIGEGRRAVLDLLRKGEVGHSQRILSAMEDMYYVLVSMDYPDAITRNLRRSTDVARGIMEKTRGDLVLSVIQRDLREALERQAHRYGRDA